MRVGGAVLLEAPPVRPRNWTLMRLRLSLAILAGFVVLGAVGGYLAVQGGLPKDLGLAQSSVAPGSASLGSPNPTPGSGGVTPSGGTSASPAAPSGPTAVTSGSVTCPDSARLPSAAPSRPPVPASFDLKVPVLMYHRVVPRAEAGNSLPSLVVPPATFARQMAALDAAGWHTITLAQLAADLQKGVRPPPKTFVVSFDDGYDDGYTYALPILQQHGFVGTFFIVAGRIGEPSILTADHVRALAAAGMEIADHTMSHANLPALDATALRYQIGGAAGVIASLTGHPPATFAYPFGDRDLRVIREVADCGFTMAVTNVEGVRETWATRFVVPRLRVGPGTSPDWLLWQRNHPAPPAPPPTPTPRSTPTPGTPSPTPVATQPSEGTAPSATLPSASLQPSASGSPGSSGSESPKPSSGETSPSATPRLDLTPTPSGSTPSAPASASSTTGGASPTTP